MDALDPALHKSPLRFFLATNSGEIKWLALNSFFYCCGTLSMLGAV